MNDRVILANGREITTDVNGRTLDGQFGSCLIDGKSIEVKRVDPQIWKQIAVNHELLEAWQAGILREYPFE